MPKPRKAPPKARLLEYLEQGLTQQEMAEAWGKETGEEIARSTISVAMARHELSGPKRERFGDLLPWSLRSEHRYHRDARYLRLESRRRRGGALTDAELRRLNAWRRELDDREAVVYYDPDSPGGWWWIKRKPFDEDLIRHPKDLIPWEVAEKHRDAPEFQLLSLEMRRRLGDVLDRDERAVLERGLADLDRRNVVIDYGPRKGWAYEPAGEDDADIVRMPKGRPAPHFPRPEVQDTWRGRFHCATCKESDVQPDAEGKCPSCGGDLHRILGTA